MKKKIAVLGAGNMGRAIIEGILTSRIKTSGIIVTRKSDTFSEEEKGKFECLTDNKEAVSQSNIVIIAVQPKQMDDLLLEIKNVLTEEHILISVVSGISMERIESLVEKKIPIFRAMPNTAIRVQESMTCIDFNELGGKYRELVRNIFDSVGITLFIPESKFAEATVLCGSGTALALKFLRGYMQGGIQNGFNAKDSLVIGSQVLKGAAMLVQDNNAHPEEAIDSVTTPGGCTIAALVEMDHAGFISALLRAIKVGIEKARKLYS